jgi:hypothetical protein
VPTTMFEGVSTLKSLLGALLWLAKKGYESEEFVAELAENVGKTLLLYRDIDAMSLEEIEEACRFVMRSICNVVFSFHRPGMSAIASELKINACLMEPVLPKDFTPELLDSVAFLPRDGRNPDTGLDAILKLRLWAWPEGQPESLTLPVEKPGRLLFGAPRAFAKVKAEYVKNTSAILHRRSQVNPFRKKGPPSHGIAYIPPVLPPGVFDSVRTYFQNNEELFRSFVSIPLKVPVGDEGPWDKMMGPYRNHPLAILNIQSSRKAILGHRQVTARRLIMRLIPLIAMLEGFILQKRILELTETGTVSA